MNEFREALSDFVNNFAYTGAIIHLVNRGYSIDRIIRENKVPCSREHIVKVIEKNKDKITISLEDFEW